MAPGAKSRRRKRNSQTRQESSKLMHSEEPELSAETPGPANEPQRMTSINQVKKEIEYFLAMDQEEVFKITSQQDVGQVRAVLQSWMFQYWWMARERLRQSTTGLSPTACVTKSLDKGRAAKLMMLLRDRDQAQSGVLDTIDLKPRQAAYTLTDETSDIFRVYFQNIEITWQDLMDAFPASHQLSLEQFYCAVYARWYYLARAGQQTDGTLKDIFTELHKPDVLPKPTFLSFDLTDDIFKRKYPEFDASSLDSSKPFTGAVVAGTLRLQLISCPFPYDLYDLWNSGPEWRKDYVSDIDDFTCMLPHSWQWMEQMSTKIKYEIQSNVTDHERYSNGPPLPSERTPETETAVEAIIRPRVTSSISASESAPQAPKTYETQKRDFAKKLEEVSDKEVFTYPEKHTAREKDFAKDAHSLREQLQKLAQQLDITRREQAEQHKKLETKLKQEQQKREVEARRVGLETKFILDDLRREIDSKQTAAPPRETLSHRAREYLPARLFRPDGSCIGLAASYHSLVVDIQKRKTDYSSAVHGPAPLTDYNNLSNFPKYQEVSSKLYGLRNWKALPLLGLGIPLPMEQSNVKPFQIKEPELDILRATAFTIWGFQHFRASHYYFKHRIPVTDPKLEDIYTSQTCTHTRLADITQHYSTFHDIHQAARQALSDSMDKALDILRLRKDAFVFCEKRRREAALKTVGPPTSPQSAPTFNLTSVTWNEMCEHDPTLQSGLEPSGDVSVVTKDDQTTMADFCLLIHESIYPQLLQEEGDNQARDAEEMTVGYEIWESIRPLISASR